MTETLTIDNTSKSAYTVYTVLYFVFYIILNSQISQVQ